jgi:O-antigen ligase/uncharacterized membrane protein YbhN (UPF0104 family)
MKGAERPAGLLGRGILKSNLLATLLPAIVSVAALAFAATTLGTRQIAEALQGFNGNVLAGVLGALLAGALLAGLRFRAMARDVGSHLTIRDSMLAMAAGQVAGTVTLALFGQIAARGFILRHRGFSLPANIAVAAYERLIALAVSLSLAALGAWILFGFIAIDMAAGGADLVRLLVAICVATAAGAVLVWGRGAASLLRHVTGRMLLLLLNRSLLTLAIQLATAIAYVVAAWSMAPASSLVALFAASTLIMFAASLPISFSGWGIRELSAIAAFSAIGVPPAAAFAISVLIGVGSFVAVGLVGLGAALVPAAGSRSTSETAVGSVDIGALLAWILPIGAATLVGFSVYVPTPNGVLNVNPADLPALLGGIVFIGLQARRARHPQWRVPHLVLYLAAMSGVIAISLLIGILRFGVTDWALLNKGLGFVVLLAYFATGTLLVSHAGEAGRETLLRTFAVGVVAVVLYCYFVAFVLGDRYAIVNGFAGNPNAFAFLLVMALCCMAYLPGWHQLWFMLICLPTVAISGSRTGMGVAAVIMCLAALLRLIPLRAFLVGCAVTATAFAVVLISVPSLWDLFEPLRVLQSFQRAASPSADPYRWASMADGLRLFVGNPTFGAGLGAFMNEQARLGRPLVIHSTPIWILAEMGLFGFLVFVGAAVRVVVGAMRNPDVAARSFLLVAVAFGAFGLVHEIMYQRAFWLLAGALLALGSSATIRGGIRADAPVSQAP